jgi:hypothetical protein
MPARPGSGTVAVRRGRWPVGTMFVLGGVLYLVGVGVVHLVTR